MENKANYNRLLKIISLISKYDLKQTDSNKKIYINLVRFDSDGFLFKRLHLSEKNVFELNSALYSTKVPYLEITITNNNNNINDQYSSLKTDYYDDDKNLQKKDPSNY